MKHLSFILVTAMVVVSCKKSTTEQPLGSSAYLTTTANSTWNYQLTDNSSSAPVINNYMLTSTTRDTSINGRTYHVFNNSDGSNQYLGISGKDYYQYDSLPFPNAQLIERLYLKEDVAANSNWVQNINLTVPGSSLPIPVVLTYTVTEKGISRTVNNITYNDVIHISTNISSSLTPAGAIVSNINSYYAPRYGLIENTTIVQVHFLSINQEINLNTILMSADIK